MKRKNRITFSVVWGLVSGLLGVVISQIADHWYPLLLCPLIFGLIFSLIYLSKDRKNRESFSEFKARMAQKKNT